MSDCSKCQTKADVPYIAYESAMARNERTVKRLIAVIIALAIILCATIGGFLWYLSQYDFTGYSQDGDGVNLIGDENGVSYNVTENAETHVEESLTGEGTGSP